MLLYCIAIVLQSLLRYFFINNNIENHSISFFDEFSYKRTTVFYKVFYIDIMRRVGMRIVMYLIILSNLILIAKSI